MNEGEINNMEKEIYKSGVNMIFELADAYKLVNKDGNYAIFDKNEKILSQIVELLNGERSFYYNKKTKMFYLNIFEEGIGKFFCSLRQLVISVEMDGDFDKNLEKVRNNVVLLVNEDEPWNLKRENLEFTGLDNNANTFYSDGKYFYIKHNKTGYTIRTDLNREFNDILKKHRWVYSAGRRAIGTFLGNNQKNFVTIYQFVRIYFDSNDKKNITSWTKILLGAMKKLRINVDHLDSDIANCCSSNLTWMRAKDNCSKGALTKKLNQKPFKCSVKSSSDCIYMTCGYNANGLNIEMTSKYNDVEKFVKELKRFWNDGIITDGNEIEFELPVVPKEYFAEDTEQPQE